MLERVLSKSLLKFRTSTRSRASSIRSSISISCPPSPISPPTPVECDPRSECLNDCISQLKAEILKIEDDHIALLANLLSISRCIKLELSPWVDYPFTDISGSHNFDLKSTVDHLTEVCTHELQKKQQRLTKVANFAWRPTPLPESERTIAAPTMLDFEICEIKGSRLEVQLCLLVWTKAELMVHKDKLEGDLGFWVGMWDNIKKERKKMESEPLMCFCYPARPSLSRTYDRQHRFSHGSGAVRERERRPGLARQDATVSVRKSRLGRKEVPVREMLERLVIEESPEEDDTSPLGEKNNMSAKSYESGFTMRKKCEEIGMNHDSLLIKKMVDDYGVLIKTMASESDFKEKEKGACVTIRKRDEGDVSVDGSDDERGVRHDSGVDMGDEVENACKKQRIEDEGVADL